MFPLGFLVVVQNPENINTSSMLNKEFSQVQITIWIYIVVEIKLVISYPQVIILNNVQASRKVSFQNYIVVQSAIIGIQCMH